MVANYSFAQIESECVRLRGQLETGSISREQFDAALDSLMTQDEQGRYWKIREDGRWFYHDGQQWLESNPPSFYQPPPPPVAPPPYTYGPPPPPPRKSGGGCWGPCFIIGLILLVLLAVAGFVAYNYMPQWTDYLRAMLTTTPVGTPTPVFDLCSYMPAEAGKTNLNDPGINFLREGKEIYRIVPRYVCNANPEKEIFVYLQVYRLLDAAKRAVIYFQGCPESISGYYDHWTCNKINFGEEGYESDKPDDPTCDLEELTHRIIWRQGCTVVRMEVRSTAITTEQVKKLRDLSKLVDAKIKNLPACPE